MSRRVPNVRQQGALLRHIPCGLRVGHVVEDDPEAKPLPVMEHSQCPRCQQHLRLPSALLPTHERISAPRWRRRNRGWGALRRALQIDRLDG